MILTVTQQVEYGVAFTDAAGNPAVVDGVPTWESSDPSIVAIEVDPADPAKAVARATGVIGTAQVTVRADADLGEGVREVIATDNVEVVAGEAVAAALQAGSPTEQPAPVEEPTDPETPADPATPAA